jgi:hypothetical protein
MCLGAGGFVVNIRSTTGIRVSIFRKEREFDGLFKEHGKRLEWLGPAEFFLNDLRSAARQWCAHICATEYDPDQQEIYLDLLDNPTVNAYANIQTYDFIAINRGSVDTFLGVFGQLLSHPSSWSRVGDAKLEQEGRAVGPNFFHPGPHTELGHIVPLCAQRQHFTVNLTTLAFHFLVMHEIGHVRNGHLDMLQNLGVQGLAEITSARMESPIDPLLRQALEIDADAYAASRSIEYAIQRTCIDPGALVPAAEAFGHAYGDDERALRTLAYAIYVLFRIFVHGDPALDNFVTSRHPPSWIRLRCIFDNFCSVVGELTGRRVSQETFCDYVFESIVDAEESIARISRRSVDLSWAMAAFDPDNSHVAATGYLGRVSDEWGAIHRELELWRRDRCRGAAGDLAGDPRGRRP